jgi:hypothetical protein
LNGCSDQNVILSDPLVFLTFYLLKYFHYFTEFIKAVIAFFQNQSVLTATTLAQLSICPAFPRVTHERMSLCAV